MARKKATPQDPWLLTPYIAEITQFYWLLAFRLMNLFIVKTWFVPDEYFQSVEVAYKQVFGVGHLSWEWQPEYALRSFIHPSLFMFIYYPLKWFGSDSNFVIRLAPHWIHCVLFAVADYYVYKLMVRLFDGKNRQAANFAFILYLSNWFVLFCAPRTLSNSLELVLTVIGLNFYPLEADRLDLKDKKCPFKFAGYVTCAALACLVRPTSALIWAPLGLRHLWLSKEKIAVLFKYLLPPALLVFTLIALLDFFMYRRITLPAWNFVNFNVLSSGSANFGVHPIYWYLNQGIPPVFTLAIFALFGVLFERVVQFVKREGSFRHLRHQPNTHLLFDLAVFYVVFHSFIAHKEHRFLLPIIPLVVSHVASYLCRSKHGKWLFVGIVVLQAPLIYYFGMQHQKAPGEIVGYLNHELQNRTVAPTQSDAILISQLIPCYSMPQYAAIHPHGLQNTIFRMLDCTPTFGKNVTLPGKSQDESDLFNYDPLNFVRHHWEQIGRSDFIIAFERQFKQMEAFLSSHGYSIAERFYNTRFPVSDNQDKWIVVATKAVRNDTLPVE